MAQLAGLLGLQGKEAKIHPYYHQMETGTIEPQGVSRRVLEALASVFKVDVREIEEAGDFELTVGRHLICLPALLLASGIERRRTRSTSRPPPRPVATCDEIDQLFLGGR